MAPRDGARGPMSASPEDEAAAFGVFAGYAA